MDTCEVDSQLILEIRTEIVDGLITETVPRPEEERLRREYDGHPSFQRWSDHDEIMMALTRAKPPTAAAQTRPSASKPSATIKSSPKTNAAVKAKANGRAVVKPKPAQKSVAQPPIPKPATVAGLPTAAAQTKPPASESVAKIKTNAAAKAKANPAVAKPARKPKAKPPIAKPADAIKAAKSASKGPAAAATKTAKEASVSAKATTKGPVAKAPPAAIISSGLEEEEAEESSSVVGEIDDGMDDDRLGTTSRPKPRLSSTPKKRKRRSVIDSDDATESVSAEVQSSKRVARESELFVGDIDGGEFTEAMCPDRARAPEADTSQTPAAKTSPQTQTLLDVGLRTVTQLLQDKGTVSSTESNRPVPADAAKKAAPQMLAVAREDALLGDDLRTVNQQPLKNTAQADSGRPATLAETSGLAAPSRQPVPIVDPTPVKQHQLKSLNAVSGEPVDATATSTTQARTVPRKQDRPAAVLRSNQAAKDVAVSSSIFPPPPRTYNAKAARKSVLESPPRGMGRRFFAAGKSTATQRLEARLHDADGATAQLNDASLRAPNLRTSSRVSAALSNVHLEDEGLQAFIQAPKKRNRIVSDSDVETEQESTEDGSPKRAARESELLADDIDDDEFSEHGDYPDRGRAPAANASQPPAATTTREKQTLPDVGLRSVTQRLRDKAQTDSDRPATVSGNSELAASSRQTVPIVVPRPTKQHQLKSKNAVSGEPIDASATNTSQARTVPRKQDRPAAVLRSNQKVQRALVHKSARRFRCTVKPCRQSYTELGSLRRHIALIHQNGSRKFTCAVCGAQFDQRSDLTRHSATRHSDVTPFVCGACGKNFSRRDNCNVHQKGCRGGPI